MPLVCLCLTGRTIAEDLAALERYRGRVDIAELRADRLDPSEALLIRSFPERAGVPCILTVRRKADGGGFEEGEGVRLVMIAKALIYARPDKTANFAYVDLESDFRVPSVEEACRTFGTKIIRSRYDLAGVPADLDAAWAGLSSAPDEIPKLAVMPRGAADLARLLTWSLGLRASERIIVGMGDYGFPSRILAERLGSIIAYTSAFAAGLPGAAPGQLEPVALEGAYRFREIGRDTAVYALGGARSVLGSRVPSLHNAAFRAAGVDAVFLPLPAEDVGSLMAAFDAAGVRGAAITVPYKEAVLSFLASRSSEVEDIGACNTLVRNIDGWSGYNTDAAGFERSLLEFLGRENLRGLRATLVGVGGGAKAVAHVLAKLGAAVLVLNRNTAKAKILARRYAFAWGPCDDRAGDVIADHADLIVQATPVGMEGGIPGDPLDWYDFSGREAVFDLIYRPARTAMLARAADAGCRICNGWPMLQYQGAAQFKLWTGREPPSVYHERG
jgi:3-dehydroquinate dehydratase/shikimate dehydrogenase